MKLWQIIGLSVGVLLLVVLQFPTFVTNQYAPPFPGAQQAFSGDCHDYGAVHDTLDPGFSQSCICTMKNVPATGFPFRNNIYDPCQQDGDITWYVQAMNWAIQLALAGLTYFLIAGIGRRIVRRG